MIKAQGIGWRLFVDISKEEFPILIGGEYSAVHLTKEEWKSLVPLVFELIEQFHQYKNKVVGDESIVLQLEKAPWTICLEGFDNSLTLKLSFSENRINSRGFEMYWPIQSADPFVQAMRLMWDSYQ